MNDSTNPSQDHEAHSADSNARGLPRPPLNPPDSRTNGALPTHEAESTALPLELPPQVDRSIFDNSSDNLLRLELPQDDRSLLERSGNLLATSAIEAEPLPLDHAKVAASTPPPSPPATLHRLIRTIAGFIILFLTLRLLALEPFGVPTGSMAPTLIGNHREGPCPRCGHLVRIGDPGPGDRGGVFEDAHCPNCSQAKIDLSASRDISGDRLLVDKNIFNLRNPRRWEVAVFRCPVDDSKPYVKRVVGLPGEEITIQDGDVYANGELLRKGLAEVRETRLPFFDLSYAPPQTWAKRWLVEPPNEDPRLPLPQPAVAPESRTVDASILHDGAVHLDASSPEKTIALTYRHTNVNEGDRETEVRAWNSYNGPPRRASRTQPVRDFALTCDVQVISGDDGLFSCRLYDGADSVTLDLTVGAKPPGLASLMREKHGGLASIRDRGLLPGQTYHLEFSFFDRRVAVALNGRPLFEPIDLPPVSKRDDVRRPLQLGARACNVIVKNLKLYHDIPYTHGGQTDITSWKLGPREYFVLGDNTSNSQDSREWRSQDADPKTGQHEPRPGVPEGAFLGKPFFIHQPLRLGRTTIGGQEREFQTLDWSRLRWLH